MSGPVFINERLLDVARREDTILVHPHAQRTGGNTIRSEVFEKLYGPEHIYCRRYREDIKTWSRLKDADLVGYRAYTDLYAFRLIKLSRPYVGLTVLRHPLYRAISIYRLARSVNTHRHHELALAVPLEEFYRRASAEHPKYFRDLQCRRICEHTDAKQSVETIKEHFVAVGFTSELPAFVKATGAALGWPDLPIRTLPPEEVRYAAVVTPSLRDMVLDQNREDLLLYETMQKGPPYTPPARSWRARVNRVLEQAEWTVQRVRKKTLDI